MRWSFLAQVLTSYIYRWMTRRWARTQWTSFRPIKVIFQRTTCYDAAQRYYKLYNVASHNLMIKLYHQTLLIKIRSTRIVFKFPYLLSVLIAISGRIRSRQSGTLATVAVEKKEVGRNLIADCGGQKLQMRAAPVHTTLRP